MLNKFWEKNIGILNGTGLLGALAALFLTVSFPENQAAQNALLSMQAILLLSLSISVVFLSRSLWTAVREIESALTVKSKIDLAFTLSVTLASLVYYFLFQMWSYLYFLYYERLIELTRPLVFGLGTLFLATVVHFYWNFSFKSTRKGPGLLGLSAIVLLTSFVISTCFEYLIRGIDFRIREVIVYSLIIFAGIFTVLSCVAIYQLYFNEKKKG